MKGKALLSNVILGVGLILILVGIKFTSIASGPYSIQNDGYNVTGGLMTMAGGVMVGYLIGRSEKK